MRARHPGMALSACVLATLAACGQAFTGGGPGGDGGEDASNDSPGAGEDSPGGDSVTGDAGGDGIAHDGVAHDGSPPHDASSIEGGSGDAMANDGVVGPAKVVFITSTLYTGDLGGLAGADSKCQSVAMLALKGTFKAWLSSTATSASQRLTHSTGPYVLTDNTTVASDWAGLTSGTLLHPIDLTETGMSAPIPTINCGSTSVLPAAWTSTAPNGSLNGMRDTCTDWTTNGPSYGAGLGVVGQTNSTWTAGCGSESSVNTDPICASQASLYCIEQ
jgi:hypothetical protein